MSQEALPVLQLSFMNAVWCEQAQNGGVRGVADQPLFSPCRPLAAVRALVMEKPDPMAYRVGYTVG